ncbi:MAG TPA: PAS domain S-box protein [Chitinophagaceae bacterium]|nr:PAS domain S-box protein [Chitinophagaceae bacterium]
MGIQAPGVKYSFLSGGGEMGQLTREKDWRKTAVGDPATWPQSLQTTLSILLNSRFPMFLFWGEAMTCFYNDAFRPSLGNNGKHPDILGMPAELGCAENWDIVQPLLQTVFETGESLWYEDLLIPVYRNGHLEDVYWTFSYSPIKNEDGKTEGAIVVCTETTGQVYATKKLKENERNFRSLVLESPVSAAVFRTSNFIIELANDASLQLWGRDASIIGRSVKEVFPELKDQPYLEILRQVYETGITYEGKEKVAHLNRNGKLDEVFVNFVYKALRDENGKINGILSMGYDVTDQIRTRNQLKELEERNRVAIEANEIGVYEKNLLTEEVIFSDKMHEIYGATEPLSPATYVDMIHPDDREMRLRAHAIALQTGKLEYQYRIILKDGSIRWIDSHAKIYFNEAGALVKRIGTIQDITEEKLMLTRIRETEKKFRNTVMQAPVGIVLMKGPEFIVETANQAYLQLVDKEEDDFVGKPLFDSLPEVKEIVAPLLTDVLNTGKPYYASELEVVLNRFGKKEPAFFNLVYQPLRESDGSISGVMAVANEVTGQVLAKFALKQREAQFSNMVMQSPIAMTIWRGPEHIIEIANETMLKKVWRKEAEQVIGKKALEVFPELHDQKYPALLKKVYTERIVHRESESVAYVQGNDGMKKFYLDFEYSPLLDKNEQVSGLMITVNDVTQKVEARQQLEDAEERLRLAAEGTGLATWDLNIQTRHIIYSPRLALVFGHAEDAVLTHQQLREQVHPEDRRLIVEPAFEAALKTGVYLYEARVLHPDGSVHWIRTQGKLFYDEQKKPMRLLGTMRDITEQKAQEEIVHRLATIVQSSDDAIISIKIDGTITSWNDAALRMFQFTEEEMIGNSVFRLIPPDKMAEEYGIIERLKKGERIEHFETARMTKDQRQLDVSLSISPLKDASGNVIGASKILRDITKQKEAERLIQKNEQKFRLLADSMPEFIWTWDNQGQLTYANKTVLDYAGLSTAQLSKDGWQQIVHPDDSKEDNRQWSHSIATGEPYLIEHRFRRHDGEYRWQLSRAIPQKDEAGNIQMWVGTSTDIDEIKKHDQQKDDFIKMASHELKTPVTTIKGYVQLLLKMHKSEKDPFLASSLQTIDKQIFKLTKLITDLLDVTKIETGSLELQKETFYIADTVNEIAEELETTIQTHKISVRQHANPLILADKDRIAQVLINLFTNAIKYSPGASEIIVSINEDKENMLLTVQDFGIGILPQDLPKIFERFYRASGKDEKTFPGFGIGLFIVNEIVSLHNGKIWVKSEKDKGALFYVSLPLTK